MWVIYAYNASNEVLYVGEDDIVYGTNNLYDVVNKAVVFKTKEEAIKFIDSEFKVNTLDYRQIFNEYYRIKL